MQSHKNVFVALSAQEKFTVLYLVLGNALKNLVSEQGYTLSDKKLLRRCFRQSFLEKVFTILLHSFCSKKNHHVGTEISA